MAPELLKVERVEDWPSSTGGKTLWVIWGETIEERPRRLRLKTTDQWKASLLERLMKTGQWAWVTWMDSYRGDPWLRRCEPDETKFQHSEAV